MTDEKSPEPNEKSTFTELANQPQQGLLREFWDFLRYNKKWWITPIIIVLLGVIYLVWLGTGSVVAPFIYSFQ